MSADNKSEQEWAAQDVAGRALGLIEFSIEQSEDGGHRVDKESLVIILNELKFNGELLINNLIQAGLLEETEVEGKETAYISLKPLKYKEPPRE